MGKIMLEIQDSDMDLFIGHWTVWKDGFLTLRPDCQDHWAAHIYNKQDFMFLKHFFS